MMPPSLWCHPQQPFQFEGGFSGWSVSPWWRFVGGGGSSYPAAAVASPSRHRAWASNPRWCRVPVSAETIAIMKQQRSGFDKLEALPMASLFWRRSQQTNSKMDTRHSIGAEQTEISLLSPLPSPCSDAVRRRILLYVADSSCVADISASPLRLAVVFFSPPLAAVSSRLPPFETAPLNSRLSEFSSTHLA
jgi:hypothetical protein